jgi:hypothetical protein
MLLQKSKKYMTINLPPKNQFIVTALLMLLPGMTLAQKKATKHPAQKAIMIPMTAARWQVTVEKAEFVQQDNVQSLKLLPGSGQAVVRDLTFTDGTIEFDVTPTDAQNFFFVGIYLRQQGPQEGECFYLRVGGKDYHKSNDAVQYAPVIKSVLLWDMMNHYQGPAPLNIKGNNHVKLVVAGKQMRAYVNDMSRPALEIPYLEGNTAQGNIALEGVATYSNLVVKPNATEDLPSVAGADLTNHDARYLRQWQITSPAVLEQARDLTEQELPKADTHWEAITAERQGLVNITRLYGSEKGNRRYVWLKAKVKAEAAQKNTMSLGFSDEVWVVLNRRLLYADKNLYSMLVRKSPDGRCAIENASFTIPFQAGDNELLICVANSFYGWGIIARLESMDGLEVVKE